MKSGEIDGRMWWNDFGVNLEWGGVNIEWIEIGWNGD
jgi:hypothetical protein